MPDMCSCEFFVIILNNEWKHEVFILEKKCYQFMWYCNAWSIFLIQLWFVYCRTGIFRNFRNFRKKSENYNLSKFFRKTFLWLVVCFAVNAVASAWHTCHVPLRTDTMTCFRWCNDSTFVNTQAAEIGCLYWESVR